MTKQQAIDKLQEKLDRISKLNNKSVESIEFKLWKSDTEIAIENILPDRLASFTKIYYYPQVQICFGSDSYDDHRYYASVFQAGLSSAEALLKSLIKEVDEYWVDDSEPILDKTPLAIVENICRKFHTIAKQLRNRHNGRATIEIKDEYDVQDLLHGLLRLHFDDIRDEEWTPSYAGKCSRVDFLLKDEQIVIEVKKTRDKLGNKELGEELIIDIARYKVHTDCKTLICFVYDPEGRITNPHGLISDLEKSKELNVKVYIE